MISPVRAYLAWLPALLLLGIVSGCGGGGGGSPSPGPGGDSTPPTVTVAAVTSVGPTSATFNGGVNPNGLPTECWFEYGTDPALETCGSTGRVPVGSEAAAQSVAHMARGLAPGTVYHYRLCASNGHGTSRSQIVDFTTRACLECHGGPDGDQPGVNGAPEITRYWRTGGHGRSFASRGALGVIGCEECHDVEYLSSAAHRTDGTAGAGPPPANVNALTWPGMIDNGNNWTTANTAHLKPGYFPSSPANKYDYARAFNRKCGDPAGGCHRVPPHNNHPQVPAGSVDPADNVMRFGDANTVPDPKAYFWYPACSDYRTEFYRSRSPWEIEDLTTSASSLGPDNGVQYGTCVTCHDPHGTGTTDRKIGGGNAMLRGNWITEAGQFCNAVCHRSP